MAFCPVCGNDTLMEGEIYTSEDGNTEYCYDSCEYCGFYEWYDCDEDLDDDGVYIDDVVVHAPYDDEE